MKPNTFLIGGPKSGTTSLSRYLRTHSHVFFSDPKGPGYFAFDFENYRYVKVLEDYLACFDGAGEQHAALCDGSTWYLYSQKAVPGILEFNPEARFIVILRNPVEQVYSFHQELFNQGNENTASFERAWDMQESRMAGRNIPSRCMEPTFLYYGDVSRFGSQIERLFGWVDRKRVKTVIYDDYIADPLSTYKDILAFLGLEWDGRLDFPTIPTRQIRSRFLTRLARRPSPMRMALADGMKKVFGIERIGFSDFIKRINTRNVSRPSLSAEMTDRLCTHFRPDIDLLSTLLGRDLSHWYDGVAADGTPRHDPPEPDLELGPPPRPST